MDAVNGRVGLVAAFAQSPAEFIAVAFADNAASVGFPAPAPIDIPAFGVGVWYVCLVVGHTEVGDGASVEIADGDIEFCAVVVNMHVANLGHLSVSVVKNLHRDVKAVQSGFGERSFHSAKPNQKKTCISDQRVHIIFCNKFGAKILIFFDITKFLCQKRLTE